ncbi:adhesion G protein-coupled receptor A2-like [Lampetra fluviatilis]
MVDKFVAFADRVRELGELVVEMVSNAMQADPGVLESAQRRYGAGRRIASALEAMAAAASGSSSISSSSSSGSSSSSSSQELYKLTVNVAVAVLRVKPPSFTGLWCSAGRRQPSPDSGGSMDGGVCE